MSVDPRTDGPPLAISSDTFRRFFEDSNDAIVITDREGKILTANPAWLALYGYALEEVAGKSTSIIKSPHTTTEMYRYMWSQIGDPAQGYWKGEIVNRKRDGTEVPILLTITPIRDPSGAIAGYTGIGIDMTERRRVEEMRELYEMVVRHDLKSPLGSILALAEMMHEGYAGAIDEKQRELLGRIVGSAKRMKEMIETGLDVKRFERGVLRLDPTDVDLIAIARESRLGLAPLAEHRGVRVALRWSDGRIIGAADRLPMRGDAVHLQRGIDNLVKNAIEASPRGEEVVVTVEELREAGRLRLRVENGGPPIPPDVRATLFHPFSTYGKRGGTGLGVYGVRTIVEAMGGTITYESDETATRFEITLPVRGD